MQDIVWICFYCAEKGTKEETHEKKLFKRYVDDIVCTVKGNPLDYLEYAISLHKNLQFTLETPDDSGDLAFLDLNIKVNEDRTISCHWYQTIHRLKINIQLSGPPVLLTRRWIK